MAMEWLLSHVSPMSSRSSTPPPLSEPQHGQQQHPVPPQWPGVMSHTLDPTFMYGGYGYHPTPFGWPPTPPPPPKAKPSSSSAQAKFPASRAGQGPANASSEDLQGLRSSSDPHRRSSLDEGRRLKPPRSAPGAPQATPAAAVSSPSSPRGGAGARDDCLLATSPSKQLGRPLQSMPSSKSMPCLSLMAGKTPRPQRVSDDRTIGMAAA